MTQRSGSWLSAHSHLPPSSTATPEVPPYRHIPEQCSGCGATSNVAQPSAFGCAATNLLAASSNLLRAAAAERCSSRPTASKNGFAEHSFCLTAVCISSLVGGTRSRSSSSSAGRVIGWRRKAATQIRRQISNKHRSATAAQMGARLFPIKPRSRPTKLDATRLLASEAVGEPSILEARHYAFQYRFVGQC